MKLTFNDLPAESLYCAARTDTINFDYFLLAHLQGEDDEECSKKHWLKEELSNAASAVEGFAAHLPHHNRTDVLKWANALFDSKVGDYYVIITERRSKKGFPLHLLDVVYASPDLLNVRKPDRTDLKEFLTCLDEQIAGFVNDTTERNLLVQRKKESGDAPAS